MTTPQMTDRPAPQRQNGYLAEPDVDGVQNLELPEAEKQRIEADGDYIPVPLGDTEIRVKPQRKWRMSHMRLLNAGDLDGWAEGVIHPDDVDAFFDVDPDMEEFQAFAEEAARRAGDSLGKSSGRSRSSRNMRVR